MMMKQNNNHNNNHNNDFGDRDFGKQHDDFDFDWNKHDFDFDFDWNKHHDDFDWCESPYPSYPYPDSGCWEYPYGCWEYPYYPYHDFDEDPFMDMGGF